MSRKKSLERIGTAEKNAVHDKGDKSRRRDELRLRCCKGSLEVGGLTAELHV